MGFTNCFDVASMVLDEATDRFGKTWKINGDKERALSQACKDIDDIAEEFDGVSYEVDVNEITMDITISLVCGEIVVRGSDSKLYSAMRNAKRVTFKNADGDNIRIDFIFGGIWEKQY